MNLPFSHNFNSDERLELDYYKDCRCEMSKKKKQKCPTKRPLTTNPQQSEPVKLQAMLDESFIPLGSQY